VSLIIYIDKVQLVHTEHKLEGEGVAIPIWKKYYFPAFQLCFTIKCRVFA